MVISTYEATIHYKNKADMGVSNFPLLVTNVNSFQVIIDYFWLKTLHLSRVHDAYFYKLYLYSGHG